MSNLVLVLDDDRDVWNKFRESLSAGRYPFRFFEKGMNAMKEIRSGFQYGIGFIDWSLPDAEGAEIVKLSKEVNPGIPIVGMSNYSPTDYPIALADYQIIKPAHLEQIIWIVQHYGLKPNLSG